MNMNWLRLYGRYALVAAPPFVSTQTSVPPFASKRNFFGREYSLAALGIRSVTFLKMQVYVVGMYICDDSLPLFSREFHNKSIQNGESDDPVAIFGRCLDNGARIAMRLVPVRNTDYEHLYTGFQRAIDFKAKEDNSIEIAHMDEFKKIFGRGKVAKNEEFILHAGPLGEITIEVNGNVIGRMWDRGIQHALILSYIGGKRVISESFKQDMRTRLVELLE